MLAATSDRLAAALAALDPGSRALLDLSLRRRLPDEEIGEFLGTDAQAVAERRARVLEDIVDDLDGAGVEDTAAVRRALMELEPESWTGAPPHRPTTEPEVVPEGHEGAPARRRMALWAVPLLLVAAVVIVALAISSSDDEEGDSGASQGTSAQPTETQELTQTQERTQTEREPQARPVRLESLSGGGRGTARLTGGGRRLDLRVSGLPDPGEDTYEIWLYDDISRARTIGSFARSSIALDARLPADPRDYEFIDISREPRDENPNHSGQSVLRLPVSELGGG